MYLALVAAVNTETGATVAGAYTRPLFGSTEALSMGVFRECHGVSAGVFVAGTAQVELRSGRM